MTEPEAPTTETEPEPTNGDDDATDDDAEAETPEGVEHLTELPDDPTPTSEGDNSVLEVATMRAAQDR